LAKWFQLRPLKAIGIWLAAQIGGILVSMSLALMFRALAFEAFTVPTNSMAPTLLGAHVVGSCPRCQQKAYGSLPDSVFDQNMPDIYAICGHDYRGCRVPGNGPRGSQDRFVVSKLHEPRRWDLIVFRYPEDPATFYVKRLVGLPGEQIVIKDGAAWANGEKLMPPEEFANLHYVFDSSEWGLPKWTVWGDERRPARLSKDEYFVLGDNSERAKDSRFWEQGADGHSPYAVPKEYIHGVVTTIYWPLSRWRAFK
jgi:signal peptidase I